MERERITAWQKRQQEAAAAAAATAAHSARERVLEDRNLLERIFVFGGYTREAVAQRLDELAYSRELQCDSWDSSSMDIGYEWTISRDAEDADIMVEGNNAALRALEELSFTCKIWRMASRFGGSNILPKHFSASTTTQKQQHPTTTDDD